MQTMPSDRHVPVRILKAAGFDDVQTEAIANAIRQSAGKNAATKADLATAIGELRAECATHTTGLVATSDNPREKVPDLCRAGLMVGICTGLGVGFCIIIGPLYPRILMGFNILMLGFFIALVTGAVDPPGMKRFSALQEKRLRRNSW